MLRTAVIKFTVLFLIVGICQSPAAKEYSFDYRKIVEIDQRLELEVNLPRGHVTVTGHDDNRLVIEAFKRINAVDMNEAAHVANNIKIEVDIEGDKVVLQTVFGEVPDRPTSIWKKVLGISNDDSFDRVDINISVPENCRITVNHQQGRINVAQVTGDVVINGSTSDIQLNSIEGNVDVSNSSGKLEGELIFGDITVRQPMGKIYLHWIEGDIKIKSTFAGIDIRQERGALDLTTTSGEVKVQTNFDCSKNCFIETESGDIKLIIPETSSGTLRMASEMGEIKTEIPVAVKSIAKNQLEGEFGQGGVKITLQSISGNVTVARF